jgi:hypothetical protein
MEDNLWSPLVTIPNLRKGETGANALLFSTATRQRIDELLKRADSAAEELNAFQQKQSENTKAKIDQLGR